MAEPNAELYAGGDVDDRAPERRPCRPLAAEAARRGLSVDELTAELLAAGLPAGEEVDALEAFIGSGDSGDPSWAGRPTRELRAEAAARQATG